MFVTEPEGALSEKSHARIRITNMQGSCVVLNVPIDFSIDKLKMEVANYLGKETSTDSDPAKISLYHKLVHVDSGRVLNEEASLADDGVQDEDELLFVKKRVPIGTPDHHKKVLTSQEEEKKNKPTTDAISSATAHVSEVNKNRKVIAPLSSDHFQRELRKILITLIDAAHKILCTNPDIDKIFQTSEDSTSSNTSTDSKKPKRKLSLNPTEETVQQIMNMGFPRHMAVKALKLNHNSCDRAIQWLLEEDRDWNAETTEADEKTETSMTEDNDNNIQAIPKLSEIRGQNRAKQVVAAFRAYKQREFKPNPKLEFLLSGKSLDSLDRNEDLETGLDPNSYVYKAIMSNPVVQFTLTNTKSLIAFSHMLDNPVNTQQWLSDPDTGAILIQISRIYHAERCSDEAMMTEDREEQAGDIDGVQVAQSDEEEEEVSVVTEALVL